MKNICDYMIIQRDNDGMGRGTFSGKIENKGCYAVTRVMREDDNATIVPWTKCEQTGNNWKINLKIPQGGLYRVETRAVRGEFCLTNNRFDWEELIACASHVGVGGVFVLAGQSNMSGYGKDPAYDPPQLGVHLYDNSGNWVLASHPLNSVANPIYPNNDSNSGTSPGLSFGKTMFRHLGVPIGLVSAAKGGSSLEWWNPAEEDHYLFDSLKAKLEQVGKFAGMLWYQGCNEAGNEDEASTYFEKFEQSISLWREEFGHFPIAVCQINRHAWKGADCDRLWGKVREAQRQAGIKLKDVYVVPTMDMGTIDGIHNSSSSCIIVGERLASVMLKGRYNLTGSVAPSIKRIKRISSDTIFLEFFSSHMLRTMDDLACGMNIEDENGMMKCTKVSVCDNGVMVFGEREIGKNAVFHAYWEREESAFFVRDIYGMPMLACYGVEIED
ncbi:MAG: hypothetical protein KBT46_00265 [Ruminococcus sp.]|nr:hypothetical protein [Candidatus Copronaster equi]